jgi:hypothetical protein
MVMSIERFMTFDGAMVDIGALPSAGNSPPSRSRRSGRRLKILKMGKMMPRGRGVGGHQAGLGA